MIEQYLDFKPNEDGSWTFPPGIYFDMPEEIYHADKSLGSSSIKALAVDPYEFQFDRLYGEDKDSDALTFGSALHARMLEGRESFESKFCLGFDKTALKGKMLITANDIKAELESIGQTKLSGTKPDLIKRLLDLQPESLIFDVEKERWEKANEGKTVLAPKRWAQIETASKWVQRDPLLSAVMKDGTFIEGSPEVSIFYEDRGVRLKARLDRLLRHAIVDLKSFAPIFDSRIETAAVKAINRFRYDLQEADYRRAWTWAQKHLHPAGLVYGDEPFEGFLDQCFDRDQVGWIWVLVKSKGAPQPLVIDWQARMARATAEDEVERAIETYIDLRDEFGDENEWPPRRPALTLEDQDLPNYFGKG